MMPRNALSRPAELTSALSVLPSIQIRPARTVFELVCAGLPGLTHRSFNIEIAFIFAEVANGMTFVEHAPYIGAQSEGVRQRLKNDIAIGRPVSMPSFTPREHCVFNCEKPNNELYAFDSRGRAVKIDRP
jgi:hypothetical protein